MKKSLPFFLLLLLTWPIPAQNFGPQIKDLLWLEGQWVCDSKPEWHEEWIKTPNGLEGRGFNLRNGKEWLIEHLQIRLLNGRLVYIALPKDTRKEVVFTADKRGNRFVFTNLKNDWPQVIVYEHLKSRQMKVSLGDVQSNGRRDKVYFFSKKKGRSWKFY